ncbi:hypothetical protein PybrP1_005951 [[Pythium] brassicae (nom. inval.)]|nr:hypothetical protein PybrP1_005951 [[Pythium] brassicae (nom. inval.)]
MHLLRFDLAQPDWFEFDRRVATVMTSADFAKLHLVDFVTTDAVLRRNGIIASLFAVKIVVLALNLTPFLLPASACSMNQERTSPNHPLEVESALAICTTALFHLPNAKNYQDIQTFSVECSAARSSIISRTRSSGNRYA